MIPRTRQEIINRLQVFMVVVDDVVRVYKLLVMKRDKDVQLVFETEEEQTRQCEVGEFVTESTIGPKNSLKL